MQRAKEAGVVEPRVKRRRRWPWVVLVLAALLPVFILIRHAATPRARAATPPTVGVARAVAGSMPVVLTALGTVTPVATVTVLPQLSGYLTEVAFTEGETVQAGQFLAQIDPRPYQINLESFEGQQAKDRAALAQAQSDLARYELLGRQNSISAQQVADQRFLAAQDLAAIQIDQANIDTAKLDLAYCHITSPVAGRVGLRLVDVGNYVTSGSTTGIAVVTTIAPTTVIFSLAQTVLAPVLERIGAGARLQATAYSSDDSTALATGKLSAVDNQVDVSTGMVKLRADFTNADNTLFPNEFVNIHLLVNTLRDATLVPTPAVQTGAPGTYVYVVNSSDTVAVQKVTTGPTDGVNTAITTGLQPGDLVVTDGVDRLSDGAKVSIAGSSPATAGTHKHKHKPGADAGQSSGSTEAGGTP